MHQFPAVAVTPGPCRYRRRVAVPGGHDHRGRLDRAVVGDHSQRPLAALDPMHLGRSLDPQPVLPRILLQVGDEGVAAWVPAGGRRQWRAGEARELSAPCAGAGCRSGGAMRRRPRRRVPTRAPRRRGVVPWRRWRGPQARRRSRSRVRASWGYSLRSKPAHDRLSLMSDTAQTDLGVLEATPPAFTPEQVSAIARELFGIDGCARDLGSERDQTFMIEGADGDGVLKISNLGEDPGALDIEVAALLHVAGGRSRPAGGPPAAAAGRRPESPSLPTTDRSSRAGRPPLRAPVRAAHRPLDGARPRAGRRGGRRLRRHLSAARPGAARLLPSRGGAQSAVGHEQRRSCAAC